MNALVKTGLLLGGLAFLFKDQMLSALYSVDAAPAVTPTPAVPAPTPAVPVTVAAPPDVPAGASPPIHPSLIDPGVLTIAEKVLAATGAGAQLSADQWNWYWAQASGVPQTADLFPPENRGAVMVLKEYIGRRGAAGLSGLANLGRVR